MNWRRTMSGAAIAAVTMLALFAGGCDDGTLTPSDGTMFLSASPSTVRIDVQNGQTSGTSTLIARVFNASELPLKDAQVVFSTDGGTLASETNTCVASRCSLTNSVCVVSADCPAAPGRAVLTDSDGYARDTLTLTTSDSSSVEVGAQSGSLVQTLTVESVQLLGPGQPQAEITIDPPDAQRKGAPVAFDGRDSIFDATASPTCYQWTISSSVPASNETVHDTAATLSRTYSVEQELTVELRVSDDPTIDCTRSGSPEPEKFSPFSDVEAYSILCDLTDPTADAVAGNGSTYSGTVNSPVSVNGGDSFDPDSAIVAWEWDCDINDTGSTGAPTGESATCTYDRIGNFTLRLTVRNACGLEAQATATVSITN